MAVLSCDAAKGKRGAKAKGRKPKSNDALPLRLLKTLSATSPIARGMFNLLMALQIILRVQSNTKKEERQQGLNLMMQIFYYKAYVKTEAAGKRKHDDNFDSVDERIETLMEELRKVSKKPGKVEKQMNDASNRLRNVIDDMFKIAKIGIENWGTDVVDHMGDDIPSPPRSSETETDTSNVMTDAFGGLTTIAGAAAKVGRNPTRLPRDAYAVMPGRQTVNKNVHNVQGAAAATAKQIADELNRNRQDASKFYGDHKDLPRRGAAATAGEAARHLTNLQAALEPKRNHE